MASSLFTDTPPPRREPMLHYLLAALITVGFCATMIYGFRYSTGSAARPDEERKPQLASVVMMSIGETVPPERSYQRDIAPWAILRDPTLMSLPNDAHGFSEILRIGAERPLQGIGERDPQLELSPGFVFPPLPVGQPAVPPVDSLALARLREPLSLPPLIEPVAPPPGVYWTTPDGRPFRRLPPLELPSLADGEAPFAFDRPTRLQTVPRALAAKAGARDDGAELPADGVERLARDIASGLVTIGQDRLVRVRVIESCGNIRLDQLAVDHLGRHLAGFPDQLQTTEDLAWWLGGERELVVHWRYAPNVRSTANPTGKEDWHDRSWH